MGPEPGGHRGEAGVEAMVEQVAQARTRRGALRQTALVGTQVGEQLCCRTVPTDAAEILVDPARAGRRKEVAQVQMKNHCPAGVQRGVSDDRLAWLKPPGRGMTAQPL